ncbi:ABC transporter permease [Paenibacillus alvei]
MIEFSEKQLWRDRLSSTVKEYVRYLRYILNGHLVLVLVFLLGAGSYYYQEWLKGISKGFPAAIIMSLLLALLVTKSPIYTFLKDADRIFLIPVESRMRKYFINCMLVSFIFQVYILLMGLGILMPLYASVNDGQFNRFWYFFLILSIVKGVNLLIRWQVQHFVNASHHTTDTLIRFCINLVILFLLFSNASPLFVLAVLVIPVLLLVYYQKATKHMGIKWEYLIAQDEKRMAGFYQLANMFTDVPHLRNRIKRRKLLDVFVSKISYKQELVFSHLYWRTFFRSGDYLGLFVRLTVIGGIALFFLSFGMGQVLLAVLFLYLTGLQLMPLWNAYQDKLWISLYPLSIDMRKSSFKKTISTVLYLQGIILSAVVALKGDFTAGLMTLIASVVFTFVFVSLYMNKKLQA